MPTKYGFILSYEESFARAVAMRMIMGRPLSAWHYLMPFIFFIFLRYKRANETFVLNFLFTKKLALDAALDIMKKGQSRQDMISRIDDKTSDILASGKGEGYSEKIRRKQMNEIDLLLDHYLKLLEAEGKNYESLVKNTYQARDTYENFLHELTRAELAVNRAAIEAVGRTETTYELISGMEKTTERVRTAQAEKIFS